MLMFFFLALMHGERYCKCYFLFCPSGSCRWRHLVLTQSVQTAMFTQRRPLAEKTLVAADSVSNVSKTTTTTTTTSATNVKKWAGVPEDLLARV